MLLRKSFRNIKSHPFFALLVLIQLFFLLLLFANSCISPQHLIPVTMDAFSVDGNRVSLIGDKLHFPSQDSSNGNENATVSSKYISVPSGAYDVTVVYASTTHAKQASQEIGYVTVVSDWHFPFGLAPLDNQHTILVGKLWIPLSSPSSFLHIDISHNGSGTLDVKSITLTESLPYRFLRIVGFLLLFTLFDFAALLFFSDVRIPVKKSHAILLLIAAASSIPFLADKLFWGHDLRFHLLRIVSVAEELGNGQFPVRMARELNNGYGYPWPIYYCDIFLYPAALLYRLSVPLQVCYQIYVILINLATTVCTYWAMGKITRKESLKLLGTGLYVLCMYRLVNINIRAAAGEYTAMVFLPLIISGLYLIYTKEKPEFKDWALLAFGMSGVIQCHILTAEMLVINFVLFCLVLLKKTLKKEVFLSYLKAAGLSVGITAWFLVPFLDYFFHHTTWIQSGNMENLKKTATDLIFLLQPFAPGKDVGNYVTIGLPFIFGIGVVLYCLVKYKRTTEFREIAQLRLFTGFAALNMLLICRYFPWTSLQMLFPAFGHQIGTIQFVWRFLTIASVLLVFAIITALKILDKNDTHTAQIISLGLVVCIIFSVSIFYYRFIDEVGTVRYYVMQPDAKTDGLYLPLGTDLDMQYSAAPQVLSGEAVLTDYGREQGIFRMHAENTSSLDATVSVPIYNYRYYYAYDESGSPLYTSATAENCLAVEIPADYQGDITVQFKAPLLWRVSELVSAVCFALFVWKMLPRRKQKQQDATISHSFIK